MSLSRLGRGERIAGACAAALILFEFFDWFAITAHAGGISREVTAFTAWQAFSTTDIVLFAASAAVLAVVAVLALDHPLAARLPVPPGLVLAVAGGLALVLVLYRLIDPPGPSGTAHVFGVSVTYGTSRKLGVFLGLIAAGGMTYGGRLALQRR